MLGVKLGLAEDYAFEKTQEILDILSKAVDKGFEGPSKESLQLAKSVFKGIAGLWKLIKDENDEEGNDDEMTKAELVKAQGER
jgi:hypothetical protein